MLFPRSSKMATVSEKGRVSVTFAGDDDVIQHIVPITERRASLRPRTSRPTPKKQVMVLKESEDEEDEQNQDEVFKPSAALVDASDIGGADLFSFKSNKRSGQMAQKASESAQAVTPKSALKSVLKKSSLRDSVGTPKRGRPRKVEATTPFRLRKRNTEVEDDASSDESVSSGEDSDTEDAENVAPCTPRSRKSASVSTPKSTPKTPAGRKRRRLVEEEQVQAQPVDAYFEAQDDLAVTSDRTLARLETPRMDHAAMSLALRDVDAPYQTERDALYQEHRGNFNKWMVDLCYGHNLLLHGLGSKRRLMEDFRTSLLKDFDHIVINGFFPSLTIKSILNSITEDILEHSGSFRNSVDQVDFIRKHYEGGEYSNFYLIIHNIDGAMLRGEKVQAVFSTLAQIRGIHVVASIDHINASLIWDQGKASRFNWLFYDVTTYDPYTEETAYETSLMVQQSGTLALSSLTHVMRSLPLNARRIFLLLVRNQLDNKDNPNFIGLAFPDLYQLCITQGCLAFPDLYQRCREAFLVNSDQTLRTQLTEFKDHKLIRTKKGVDGMEYLISPLDTTTITEFLDTQEDE